MTKRRIFQTQRAGPDCVRTEELVLHLPAAVGRGAGPAPFLGKMEEPALVTQENWATTQAQTQGFEVSYPSIYPIYELMEHVKRQGQQIQSYRISMTQGNNRIYQRSPNKNPVWIV